MGMGERVGVVGKSRSSLSLSRSLAAVVWKSHRTDLRLLLLRPPHPQRQRQRPPREEEEQRLHCCSPISSSPTSGSSLFPRSTAAAAEVETETETAARSSPTSIAKEKRGRKGNGKEEEEEEENYREYRVPEYGAMEGGKQGRLRRRFSLSLRSAKALQLWPEGRRGENRITLRIHQSCGRAQKGKKRKKKGFVGGCHQRGWRMTLCCKGEGGVMARPSVGQTDGWTKGGRTRSTVGV